MSQQQVIELTEDEWDDYNPIANPFRDGEQQQFETYGEELEYVLQQPNENVWTEMDGDDGGIYLVNGFAYVNRIAYYVTEKPWDADKHYEVRLREGGLCEECDEPEDSCDCPPEPDYDLLRKQYIEEQLGEV